jgi:hypothetical protein
MTLINKWANEQFSKEVRLTNKYIKKNSTSLVMREMQINMTLRFHVTMVRMAITKNQTKTNAEVGSGKNNTSTLLVGMQISATTVKINIEFPQKTENGANMVFYFTPGHIVQGM